MILESAYLHVKSGQTSAFESDFKTALKYIQAIDGFQSLKLSKCVEEDHKYLLLVEWRSLEDHTIGFRESAGYRQWKALLHHYYEPFPVVEHFSQVVTTSPI